MNLKTFALLTITHGAVAVAGFAGGIYALPILTAPPAPTEAEISQVSANAMFSGEFHRDLKDSDGFHWGEGKVAITTETVSLMGRLAPGPDYKLYLSPQFLETEADFEKLKPEMVQVGDVKTFENFVVEIPAGINPAEYNSVIVWCESFGEFITAAKYR